MSSPADNITVPTASEVLQLWSPLLPLDYTLGWGVIPIMLKWGLMACFDQVTNIVGMCCS